MTTALDIAVTGILSTVEIEVPQQAPITLAVSSAQATAVEVNLATMGPRGADNFEIWKSLSGNEGKTEQDYFDSLKDTSGFQVVNRFSEIAEDEVAKSQARTNLGLATIDGGTFF